MLYENELFVFLTVKALSLDMLQFIDPHLLI